MRFKIRYAWVAMLLAAAAAADTGEQVIARGRYLVTIGGCNDCHTPGYVQSNGQVPEESWLQGSSVGFSGPWGVSYPGNLRLLVAGMEPDNWLNRVDAGGLPPMPWPALQAMNTEDRIAVYQYLRALGPAGEWSPVAQPPGEAIRTQHISFVPRGPDVSVAQTGQ